MRKIFFVVSMILFLFGLNVIGNDGFLKIREEVVVNKTTKVPTKYGTKYVKTKVVLPVTNIPWMDKLLISQINDENGKSFSTKIELIQKISKEHINNSKVSNVSVDYASHFEDYQIMTYEGNVNNVFLFEYINSVSGHANYQTTKDINIDVKKKKILLLTDLLISDDYILVLERRLDSKSDKKVSLYPDTDFKVTSEGLKIVVDYYRTWKEYETLGWYEINDLLKPEYRRKDYFD